MYKQTFQNSWCINIDWKLIHASSRKEKNKLEKCIHHTCTKMYSQHVRRWFFLMTWSIMSIFFYNVHQCCRSAYLDWSDAQESIRDWLWLIRAVARSVVTSSTSHTSLVHTTRRLLARSVSVSDYENTSY